MQQDYDAVKGIYITQSRADELDRKYHDLSEERTQQDINIMNLRSELHEEQDKC